MKLLSPRDAQAYNGAAICGSRLHQHKIVEENFRMIKGANFPLTAQEWFILGEVQELTSYTYKEDVLKSYFKATTLDPTNSIYAAKLWKKLGQHGSKKSWTDFQDRMSVKGKNHQHMVARAERATLSEQQRLAVPQIGGPPGVEDPLLNNKTRHVAPSDNGQLLGEARLESMESRYNAIREVRD